jgi:hypothetical protein
MAGIVNQPRPETPVAAPVVEKDDPAVFIHEDGFNYHEKHVFNPPEDKRLCWRGPIAERTGQLADWPVYTEAMLRQDYKNFGTRLARPYRLEGNRMVNGISWLVYRPMELVLRQEAARKAREELTMKSFPGGQRGKIKVVDKGKTRVDYSQEASED